MSVALTQREKRAIKALQDLAADWPDTLWIFVSIGSVSVMKKTADGKRATAKHGSFDPAFSVAQIQIEIDAGDF